MPQIKKSNKSKNKVCYFKKLHIVTSIVKNILDIFSYFIKKRIGSVRSTTYFFIFCPKTKKSNINYN